MQRCVALLVAGIDVCAGMDEQTDALSAGTVDVLVAIVASRKESCFAFLVLCVDIRVVAEHLRITGLCGGNQDLRPTLKRESKIAALLRNPLFAEVSIGLSAVVDEHADGVDLADLRGAE